MKRMNYLTSILLFISIIFLSTNCKKDHSNNVAPLSHADSISLEINQFIWSGLHSNYLWVDKVPQLSSSYFKQDEKNLDTFLIAHPDHEKFFKNLLYSQLDKWSWIVDDYTTLENQLKGISKSFGYEYGLSYYSSSSSDVFAYVIYVLKGSPADKAGLKRGDIIIKVDNQTITDKNYATLLFDRDSYTLSLGKINSSYYIEPTGVNASLNALEFQENPIFMDTIYNISNRQIGYLIYNGFYSDFDVPLNSVFKKFKDKGVQDLILDLRYNLGGSIQSAIYLSSMIYSTDKTQLFATSQFNQTLETYFKNKYGDSFFNDYFADTITRTTAIPTPTTINSLGLKKIHIIISDHTASASELVINGLKPYLDIVLVGTNSVGKYVGSITIKDENEQGVVNPNHKWAMQPIVLKIANSKGVSDYVNGFSPDVKIEDNLKYYQPLGDTIEPLLKAALNDLTGVSQQSALLKSASSYQSIAISKDFKPHSKEMYKDLKSLKTSNRTWDK